MANIATKPASGDIAATTATRSRNILSKLVLNNTFNCECCGSFFKTAVFSVYYIGTVCEDCLNKKKWQGERLKFFDVILQNLPVVSCTYADAGCQLKVLPEDIAFHLKSCKYRPVDCPSPECSWQNKQDDLAEHFEQAHPSDVIAAETVFDLDISRESFVATKLLIEPCEKYLIVIRREPKSNCILYSAFKVKKGNVHDVYIRHSCEGSEAFGKHITTKELNEIDNNCVLNKTNLIILKELSDGKNHLSMAIKVLKSKDEQMLSCLGCGETMRRPIYKCAANHNCCDSCWSEKISQCPVCRLKIDKDSTNAHLEVATLNVYYSCGNRAFGCDVRLKGDEIVRHESKCSIIHSVPIAGCVFNKNNSVLKHHKLNLHVTRKTKRLKRFYSEDEEEDELECYYESKNAYL